LLKKADNFAYLEDISKFAGLFQSLRMDDYGKINSELVLLRTY